jgi:hypothetical protein
MFLMLVLMLLMLVSMFLLLVMIGGNSVLEASFFLPGNLYGSSLLAFMLAPWLLYNKFYSCFYSNSNSKSIKLFSSTFLFGKIDCFCSFFERPVLDLMSLREFYFLSSFTIVRSW